MQTPVADSQLAHMPGPFVEVSLTAAAAAHAKRLGKQHFPAFPRATHVWQV